MPCNAAGAPLFTFPIIVGIMLAFISAGLSLEDYPSMALAAILLSPVALFLYIPLVGILVPQVHGAVYVMAAAPCVLLVMAVRLRLPSRLTVGARHHPHRLSRLDRQHSAYYERSVCEGQGV